MVFQQEGPLAAEEKCSCGEYEGEIFDSEELFWDQKNEKSTPSYIVIKRGVTEIKGYGFESNQAMTDYRIFRPHDGKLPFQRIR